eukprot:1141187-Alexandrium_andersonii.AAC.1
MQSTFAMCCGGPQLAAVRPSFPRTSGSPASWPAVRWPSPPPRQLPHQRLETEFWTSGLNQFAANRNG